MTNHTGRGRTVRAAALAATGALALAACSGGGDTPGQQQAAEFTGTYDGPEVTLSYWNGFTGGDGPFMQSMVDEFNAEHDNITVESNTIEWAEFYQKLPAAVTAGEGPDVGVMHIEQLSSNAVRQVIDPVDPLLEGIGLTADDFTQEIWDATEYEGQHYGVPLDVHSLAMYYNTEHFEEAGITEPPTDAESFGAALDALQEAGHEHPFWMPARWPAHLMFLSGVWQGGGEPYAADGASATFDSAEGVETLEWMRSMVDDGYSPASVDADAQYVAFKNGETSITFDGIWQINDLEESGLPYAAVPVPALLGEQATWASSHQFFLPHQNDPDEDKVAAAQVFVAWMSEHSGEWAGAGMIPARESVRTSGVLDGTVQEPIADAIDTMRFLPPVPGLGTIQAETLEVAVADGVLGDRAPDVALTEEAERATALMEENLARFGG
ncbi:multiple sugar transport system substrate-binding protein [Isoptericola sp. CG 20/1183]|uniref:Multiple sugar transport system substrate-binding protein n=1 Tax=Isoptericola halotolerans TaxID=300560 RepID=A0ABX5EGK6_9MICO|nr:MULTISPECIES: ABC transporter substrate-binding protein [Isoptericola]PRZ06361.1 multiple sugar transport system substrate-binding protein [Isoptericola halotolerans]PRZ06833.1 multiple sugar transport system substrate-binding protein [Isoptericola sp. CG 20/1183]